MEEAHDMRSVALLVVVVTAGCIRNIEVDNCTLEVCNGVDDDCDNQIDEGFDLGVACDGPDSDMCPDGVTVCGGTGTVCDDPGEENADLCNGVADEDCDPVTPDGSGEPTFADPCDGPDADSCADGSIVCVGGELVCNDATGDNVEVCNSVDDDCDGMTDEGFDLAGDVANCGACGNVCTNAHGTTDCVSGGCVFACDPGAEDCNGDADDGCEVLRDTNPTCAESVDLGMVAGDGVTEFVEHDGAEEGVFVVWVLEESSSDTPPTALVELESPAGANFDLYVSCGGACGGALMGSSTLPEGEVDSIDFRTDDRSGETDSRPLYIEVRFAGGETCGDYTLRVTGPNPSNVPVDTCP
jgi:hypothetical protein